ncbi:MAG: AbrB/MazE/SpoVT family DNA-binding domain-containing protein [Rhodoferax sp.]|jgi:AbrB family looped-hinge helix DNA binding protein|nr:AbrB/MazE/SpoVT family DNA-binding domain-containing protein [Rhodoferax sp.]
MRITSKGQVTIPQAIRAQAGLHPHSEVEFEIRPGGEVVIRPVRPADTGIRAAFQRVRGTANAPQFKGMDTDAFMAFLRG